MIREQFVIKKSQEVQLVKCFIITTFTQTRYVVLVRLHPLEMSPNRLKALHFALALMLADVNLAERVIFV